MISPKTRALPGRLDMYGILMSTFKCKTTDGRVVHFSVYQRAGGSEIVGPNFEHHRCPPSVKNTRDAKTEIAKVYGVEVIS